MRSWMIVAGVMVLAAAGAVAAKGSGKSHHSGHSAPAASGTKDEYDYYVMALSWSPTFCQTRADEDEQCGRKGFGFILHGLWPQYENGGGPELCTTEDEPDRKTVANTLAFMPSRRLIEHEWQTHGSCSGLDPTAYFAQADRAFASVQVPPQLKAPRQSPSLSADELERAFIAANPGMNDSMLGIVCREGSQLSEVRVCLDRDTLAPQACGGRVRNTCRYGKLRIPAID